MLQNFVEGKKNSFRFVSFFYIKGNVLFNIEVTWSPCNVCNHC